MTAQEFEYKGMHCKKWLSDNEKAKIQIIHGLGEMSEYYEQFAEYITAKGVSVYLCEYREHGRTALPADIDNIVQTAAKECGDFSSYVHSESDIHTAVCARSQPWRTDGSICYLPLR